MNRITSAYYYATGENENYDLGGVTYDKNGNITYLNRYGAFTNEANIFTEMDDLIYTYEAGTNKLVSVKDYGNGDMGFKDGANASTEYFYDANGNLIKDLNKNINRIEYNHLSLPTEIYFKDGKRGLGSIKYIYGAGGTKLQKIVSQGRSITTTDYAGNQIYENNNLQFFGHAEGYVKKDTEGFKYVYQYKDHLGNVRLSYTDNNKDGVIQIAGGASEIIEESNYYPFGLKHKGYNNNVSSLGNSTAQKFGYNGKELNEELGIEWHDFGARNYDASLGRWMNIDPLGEKYPSSNPYEYTFNNPMAFFDPDGMENIIYIVYTNDDDEGRKEVEDMISKANALLKEYGIETRLQMFTSESDEGIDRGALDDTDGIVLIGSEENVKAYDRKNNLSGDWSANREGNKGWRTSDDGYNPELTRQGDNRISYITSNEKDDRLMLFTLHGLGHQKKQITNYDDHVYGKENYPSIMNTGVDLFAYMRKRGAKASDILSKKQNGNRHWKRRMEANFGTKKAKDNYNKNDKSRVGPRRKNGKF